MTLPVRATTARNLAILGSTGSIGQSTLEVVRHSGGRLRVVALSAHSNTEQLCQQALEFRPRWVIPTDPAAAKKCDWSALNGVSEVVCATDGMQQVVQHADVDVVVAAIVGSAGLAGTWAALEAGKTVALANKETLVMAGPLVMPLAASRNAKILPIDSEHSAVFQALAAGRREDLRRIVLTASGGPFRKLTKQQMSQVTVEQALAHPTWRMGPKITVDSATMMNKALEIIEARWLFDLPPDQIEVMVHPQSVVHSLVEFNDGSVLAQLSPPDMKLPIQYALTWPERLPSPARKVDWRTSWQLEFEPPDEDRFPALPLGREVAKVGGTAGAVLNAANEAAVARFLRGEMPFLQIVPVCRAVIDHHSYDPSPTLSQLMQLDTWAREEVQRWIG
ncbi:1-deoxy-D-xylulose 5-phosphate reductoisomerase [Anatilimnocola aggregata]|uniref:1-deoxy-D-xylulose 5-phosphate reductoisomerase n=1 Tax=Anatilimnocola aggregata TaxID=2528021 RepID=A0A517YEG8_9BACT|nr:1-deoxy-D-xylulose-5-phosphate reductoisomerase [Anatilimnocola aggregata]QDU28607.1 1-deoxy-D-xylulose 5-phosphate reductoisomerase [Anatilimnocola aggregata]